MVRLSVGNRRKPRHRWKRRGRGFQEKVTSASLLDREQVQRERARQKGGQLWRQEAET